MVRPPTRLLQDCRHPDPPAEFLNAEDLRTYSLAASRYILAYEQAVNACNADKRALRQWYGEVGPEVGD